MPIRSTQRLPASPCTTFAPSALSVCAVLRHRRRRCSSSGVIATLLSVAACRWCCCYDVMLLWRRYVQFLLWCSSSVSEINWNWNKAPSRGQNEPPSILEKNLGPPWKYLPWSEKVNYFELVELLVAKFDRRFSQPGMNCLWLGVDVKPNDVDVIVNSKSVFVASRSSLIRQLESLNDLCDSDQSKLSDVVSK